MSTSVGKNQSNTVGIDQTESVGGIKNLSVGAHFITNVIGKMIELVKGSKESKAKEVKENTKMRQIASSGNNTIHSAKTFNNNSGNNLKMH